MNILKVSLLTNHIPGGMVPGISDGNFKRRRRPLRSLEITSMHPFDFNDCNFSYAVLSDIELPAVPMPQAGRARADLKPMTTSSLPRSRLWRKM